MNSQLSIVNSPLLRCFPIQVYADDEEYDIGYPHGHDGWCVSVDGKGGRDGLEQDVSEAQCYAYAQVQSHAALDLLGR